MGSAQLVHVFHPGKAPFRGLASSSDPFAIQVGHFYASENVRTLNGVLSVRAGQALLQNAPTAGSYVGSEVVTIGLYTYAILALNVSSAVRLYWNQYNESSNSWSGWVEATAASGQYGNTRMSLPTYGYVKIATAPYYSSFPSVVVQNGVDAPRHFLLTGAAGGCATVKAVAAPEWAPSSVPMFRPAAWLAMTTGTASTSFSETHVTAATFSYVTNNWDLSYTASSATTGLVSDSVSIYQTGSTFDLTKSQQFWLVANCSDDSLFQCCKVSLIRSGGAEVVINDPSVADGRIFVPTNIGGVNLYAFPLTSSQQFSDFKGIKITVVSAQLLAGTLKVYGMYGSGNVPGYALYKVCYKCSGSRSESAGLVMRPGSTANPNDGVAHFDHIVQGSSGVAAAAARPDLDGKFKLPVSTQLFYTVQLPLKSPISSEVANGVDTVGIYRKDADSDDYYLVQEQQCSQYTAGSWTYYTPWTAFDQVQLVTDTVSSDTLTYSKRGPDAENTTMPTGTCVLSANNRFYVGALSTATSIGCSVFGSEEKEPFRYRSVVRQLAGQFDTASGFENRLPVGDTIQSMLAVSTSILGNSALMVWTDSALYSMDQFKARRIASIGTKSPMTVCERGGAVYFVDHQNVQRRMVVSSKSLSRENVQDQFDAVSRANHPYMWSCCTRDRIYTVLPQSPTSKVIVYYELRGYYESVDTFASGAPVPVALHAFRTSGQNQLVSYDSAGNIYDYEAGVNDNSKPIGFKVSAGALNDGKTLKMVVRSAEVLCTDQAAVNLSITRTSYTNPSSTAVSNCTMPGTKTNQWFSDQGQSKAIDDIGVQVTISANVQYPFSVQMIGFMVDPAGQRGPDGL